MLSVAVVSLLSAGYQVRSKRRAQRVELQHRSQVLAESLQTNAETLLKNDSGRNLQRLVERFANREHLVGVAVYDKDGKPLAVTPALQTLLGTRPAVVDQAIARGQEAGEFQRTGAKYLHVYAVPLLNEQETIGGLAVVSDAGYIEADSTRAWRVSFLHFLVQAFLVALVTLLVVRWTVQDPISRAAQWMKALRAGRVSAEGAFPGGELFRPLATEVAHLADSLSAARKAAEQEASLREAGESLWTAERLAVHVRSRLNGSRLVVVSNREPYSHSRRTGSLAVIVPASGLVTALEPILRACEGTWIAHGSGDADRETVDRHDRLRVPRKNLGIRCGGCG